MDDNALDIILRLQDELSPALAKAQTAIRDSAASLATHGETGSKSFQEIDASSHDWLGTLGEIATAVGLAFSIEGSIEFLKTIAEEAHQLSLLSLQTHINVEDLQVLSAATREYGVDGDQLGKALFQLQQRIAGGDASVATAYHLMGLSLDEVRGKDAMDLFLTTERGLGTLSGAIQDTAAKDLYGGRLGASLIAFSSGADEAIEKARGINIASEESVKATADLVNQVDRATASFHAWFIEIEGHAAGAFNALNDAADKGGSKWAVFWAGLKDGLLTLATGVPHVTNLTDKLLLGADAAAQDATNTAAAKAAHEAAATAIDAHAQATKFMTALELDAAKPILAWQEDYLQHLKDIGALNAKNAAGIGVTADQLARWTKETESAEAATEALYAETLKYDELLTHMDKETFTLAMEHEKQWRDERLATMARVNAAVLAEFDAQTKLNAEWGLNAAGAIRVQGGALDALNQKLTELHAKRVEGISQEKEEQLLMDEYTKALYDDAMAQDAVAASTAKAADATVSATTKFNDFRGTLVLGVTDLVSVNKELSDFYDQLAAQGPLGMPGASGIGTPGSIAQPRVIGGIPTRDAGGAVAAGQPYYIGTGAQPELFIPSTSGTMVPAGAGGTTVHLTLQVTQPLGTPNAIADAVLPALTDRLRAIGVKF